jgi:hypothetical protein
MRWEDKTNTRMDLKETGCEDGSWMELAQDRVQWRALAFGSCYQGVGWLIRLE